VPSLDPYSPENVRRRRKAEDDDLTRRLGAISKKLSAITPETQAEIDAKPRRRSKNVVNNKALADTAFEKLQKMLAKE
jgi:hypothetical protein